MRARLQSSLMVAGLGRRCRRWWHRPLRRFWARLWPSGTAEKCLCWSNSLTPVRICLSRFTLTTRWLCASITSWVRARCGMFWTLSQGLAYMPVSRRNSRPMSTSGWWRTGLSLRLWRVMRRTQVMCFTSRLGVCMQFAAGSCWPRFSSHRTLLTGFSTITGRDLTASRANSILPMLLRHLTTRLSGNIGPIMLFGMTVRT